MIIEQKKLMGKVFLLGGIPEASRFLQAFDVFLLSSIKEGLPYVLLEAGLSGVPIVSTSVGGITSTLASGAFGELVNPKNPKEILDTLVKIKNGRAEAKIKALAFQKKVTEKYFLEKMVVHTKELYSL